MIDPTTCRHEDTEAVYAVFHPHRHPVQVGDEVGYFNGGRPVARICVDCMAQLPAAWGCPECEWSQIVEPRRLCDEHDTHLDVLDRPCKEHA